MNKPSALLFLIASLFLIGCVPSIRGLYTEDTLFYDSSLEGLWYGQDNNQRWQFYPHPEIEKAYQVIYLDDDQNPGYFTGRLTRLADQTFLDLQAGLPKNDNDFHRLHLLPMHTFLRIPQIQPQLSLAVMNPETLKKIVTANPQIIRHEQETNGVILTDTTGHLRQFVQNNLNTPEFFGDAFTLIRRENPMLKVGQRAPDFTVADQNGNPVTLSDFQGKQNVVLIFYPGDSTPGCTRQLCAVRDDYAQFQQAQVAFFGVNPQNADSHKKFIEKNLYPFPLLVDSQKQIIKPYGCDGAIFTRRTVYAIDKKGFIVFVQEGMPANADILKSLAESK